MRHDVVLERFNCRLRPVCLEDAEFIIRVRTQERAAGKIGHTTTSISDQVAWISRYLERENDYYWIIECVKTGMPIGVIGLYDFTQDGLEAMPGRWVMMPQKEVSAMAPIFLMYGFAFESLGVRRLAISVMPDNRQILRFHEDVCGAHAVAVPERYVRAERESGIHQRWFEFLFADWMRMKADWTPVLSSF